MRKFSYSFIILIVFIISSVAALSQSSGGEQSTDGQKPKYRVQSAFTADFLGLAFDHASLTYEQKISPSNSFTASLNFWPVKNFSAFGFGGSYRWYPRIFDDRKKPFEGLSVGVQMTIGFFRWTGMDTYDNNFTYLGIGGEVAYKVVISDFVIEPIMKITKNFSKTYGEYDDNPFNLGVNLGWSW